MEFAELDIEGLPISPKFGEMLKTYKHFATLISELLMLHDRVGIEPNEHLREYAKALYAVLDKKCANYIVNRVLELTDNDMDF